jgi:ribosomal protein S18 acetylase RimI-like enzyme
LGKYLGREIIKLTKERLKIKIVRLGVYSANKPAQKLYKKLGFKMVASIPKQVQYKGKLIDEFIMLKYL